MALFRNIVFSILSLYILSFPFPHVHADNLPLRVGMIRDLYLRYADQDTTIYNGVSYWVTWVNKQGGFPWGNGTRKVDPVITLQAIAPDPTQLNSTITAAVLSLVFDYNIDIYVSPSSFERSYYSLVVTERYGIPNFIVDVTSDSLWKTNRFKNIFTIQMTPSRMVPFALDVVSPYVKNYTMLVSSDAGSATVATAVKSYFNARNITLIKSSTINNNASDTSKLEGDIRNVLLNSNVTNADLLVGVFYEPNFPQLINGFNDAESSVKAAVYMMPGFLNMANSYGTGTASDFWIGATQFDAPNSNGVSGIFGGDYSQFVSQFTTYNGIPPEPLATIAAGSLMSFYVAAIQLNATNISTIASYLKVMPATNLFCGMVQYNTTTGANMIQNMRPFQFNNSIGTYINSTRKATFPAQWPWIVHPNSNNGPASKINIKLIVAVVVPLSAGILIIVGAVVMFVHRQRQQAVIALIKTEEGQKRNYRIDFKSLVVGVLIGSGSFGHVYCGEYRGADVAIKKLKHQKMTKQQLEELSQESAVMTGLRHPNIVLFMGVCLDPPELCIITEFMNRGSLHDVLHNDKLQLPFPLLRNMILDIIKGLQFIHSAGIIHRDLKSPNLLVDKNWTIKIADFGLSCAKTASNDDAQISLLWTAPEVLLQEKGCHTEKSDVYSFGIIIWEIMSRQTPFDGIAAAAISPMVVSGKRPLLFPEWTEVISSTISKCWDQNASLRPTVKQVRVIVEAIEVDPNFLPGSSASLERYSEEVSAPTGTVTFVFTDVQGSTKLWEYDPRVMMRSLTLHNEVLRTQMKRLGGYEVKTEGDAFMISFSDPLNAVNFCLRAQLDLLRTNWPEKLIQHPDACEDYNEEGDVLLQKGIRVRMGIYTGQPLCEKDPVTGRMDYFGPVVNTAARISNFAQGGQILCNTETYTAIMGSMSKVDAFCIDSLGMCRLRGVKEAMNLYQVVPQVLKGRLHLLRTPASNQVNNLNVSTDGSDGRFEFGLHKEKWIINYESLTVGSKIGVGTFGDVFSAIYNGEKVAVKKFLKQKVTDNVLLELRTESAILCELQHPNILRFIGMCIKPPNLCLVAEFLERGSLSNILYNNDNHMNWDHKKGIAQDIATGLAYLHKNSIIHRDVKSSNMLVAADWKVKIADFGFSRVKADNQTMTQCGTVAWTAPEIFEGSHYTEKADVFSYAVILWELVFRKKPWEGVHSMKVIQMVGSGKRLSLNNVPTDAPQDFVDLIKLCWSHEPSQRPSFPQIIEQFYLTDSHV
jgi:serine/threonine protein kinase/ABC-type branched-subunit amino acid transport system substrate-binding protein